MQAKVKEKLTQPVPMQSRIRQGHLLSPLLFNRITEEIIQEVHQGHG